MNWVIAMIWFCLWWWLCNGNDNADSDVGMTVAVLIINWQPWWWQWWVTVMRIMAINTGYIVESAVGMLNVDCNEYNNDVDDVNHDSDSNGNVLDSGDDHGNKNTFCWCHPR